MKLFTFNKKTTGKAYYEYLLGSLFFLCLGLFAIIFLKKGDVVHFLNENGNRRLDDFFKLYTILGLGGVMAVLALVFLFIRYYYSILLAVSLVGSGLIVFLFKKVLFTEAPRPTSFYGLDAFYRVVEGVEFHNLGTFPSGHTLTAFATATILSLATNNKGIGYVLSVMAVGVAVSRVYLLQHFFMDVYVGGLLGTLMVMGIHLCLSRYESMFSGNVIRDIKYGQLKASEHKMQPKSL